METNPTVPEERGRRILTILLLAIGCILLAVSYAIGVSDNPPGIVSLILGGFSVVTGIFYLFGKSGGRTPARELLYLAPRTLCITFAVFTGIFAFDVFGGGGNFWETTFALIMHLIPTFLILILLAVSWRWEWIGGILFLVLSVLYVVSVWGRPFAVWWSLLLMAGPLVLVGVLFLLNWFYRDALRGTTAGRTTPLWLSPAVVAAGFVGAGLVYFATLPAMVPVTFSIDAPAAGQVSVAGTFNGWMHHPMVKQPDGKWQATLSLPAGRYEYKFIVDSVWTHDVNNPVKVELAPPLVGYNSVIIVQSRDSLSTKR